MGGIRAARGRYVIMGDADDSYDFGEVPRFVERAAQRLRPGPGLPAAVWRRDGPAGSDAVAPPLVRQPGAFAHWRAVMFRMPVHDIYCGMRGFTRDMFDRLELQCTGMEFATEMIIKASLFDQRMRRSRSRCRPTDDARGGPHLRTFRDGWRTLRFFLIFSPRWLFWYSGWALMLLGLVGYAVALPGLTIGGVDLRRAHAARRQHGAAVRLSVRGVRRVDHDLCHQAAVPSVEPAHRQVLPDVHARAGIVAGLVAVLAGICGHCWPPPQRGIGPISARWTTLRRCGSSSPASTLVTLGAPGAQQLSVQHAGTGPPLNVACPAGSRTDSDRFTVGWSIPAVSMCWHRISPS